MSTLKQLIDEGHNYGMNAKLYYFDHEAWVNESLQKKFLIWARKVLHYLEKYFPNSSDIKEVRDMLTKDHQECHIETYKLIISVLESLDDNESYLEVDNDDCLLYTVLTKFGLFARQLNRRHDNRMGIDIQNEYDVQDLLHALLVAYFDDVRAEDPVPQCAGGSSRVDFFIADISTVIEVKMPRKGLEDKEIGDQILVDIGRYPKRTDIRRMVFFIYDPNCLLKNPNGLKDDIQAKSNENYIINVVITS